MKEQTWTYLDRTKWPHGEWDNEPDKMQWVDEKTGLPCLVVRNLSGALCGYVGVAEGHPAFGLEYDNVKPYPDVHGGLTFSSFCKPYGENNERGVCHVVEEGENERVWWLGFDCAHCNDLIPAYDWSREFGNDYRTISYVRSECASLASQLSTGSVL